MRTAVASALVLLAVEAAVSAHVGSPDVFFEGAAGDYRLLVVIRMPRVIPGVADIELRSLSPGLRSIQVTPLRIRGVGSGLSPVADIAERAGDAPDLYRAQLWIMQRGAWKVRILARGDRGDAELSVPIGATSSATRPMAPPLKLLLGALAVLLIVGAIAIVGAAVREATVRPGVDTPASAIRRARLVMVAAAAVIAALVWLGDLWWRRAASDAEAVVYGPPHVGVRLVAPSTLSVALDSSNTDRLTGRAGPNDLIADHGHLMHLFLIREPGMDFLVHLHPESVDRGGFAQLLPSMPEGRYRVFADVVHASGFPETETAAITLPQIVSGLPDGDDSLTPAMALVTGPQTGSAPLSAGVWMQWVNGSDTFRAGEPVWLRFRIVGGDGHPLADLQPYMGMAAHLVLVRADWQVFAHLHPGGSAPMAAVELANGSSMPVHAGHAPLSAEITFPYGFPDAGHYRLFVQVKRAGRVETGVFDAEVRPGRG